MNTTDEEIVRVCTEYTQQYSDGFITKEEHSDMIFKYLYECGKIK